MPQLTLRLNGAAKKIRILKMALGKIRIWAIILKFEFKINSNFKKTRMSDEGLKLTLTKTRMSRNRGQLNFFKIRININ